MSQSSSSNSVFGLPRLVFFLLLFFLLGIVLTILGTVEFDLPEIFANRTWSELFIAIGLTFCAAVIFVFVDNALDRSRANIIAEEVVQRVNSGLTDLFSDVRRKAACSILENQDIQITDAFVCSVLLSYANQFGSCSDATRGVADILDIARDNLRYFESTTKRPRFDYHLDVNLSPLQEGDPLRDGYFKQTQEITYVREYTGADFLVFACSTREKFDQLTRDNNDYVWVHLASFQQTLPGEKRFEVLLKVFDEKTQRPCELSQHLESGQDATLFRYCLSDPEALQGKRAKIRLTISTITKRSLARYFFTITQPTRGLRFTISAEKTDITEMQYVPHLVCNREPEVTLYPAGSDKKTGYCVTVDGWIFKSSGMVFPWGT